MKEKGIIIRYSNWWLFRAKIWPSWLWALYRLVTSTIRPRSFKNMPLPDGSGKKVRYYPFYSKEFCSRVMKLASRPTPKKPLDKLKVDAYYPI